MKKTVARVRTLTLRAVLVVSVLATALVAFGGVAWASGELGC